MAAQAASDEAASLAMALAGEAELYESLRARADAAESREDLLAAEALLQEALGVALAAGNGVGTSACRLGLAWVANQQGRHDEADDLLAENLPFVRGLGQIRCEGFTLAFMADTVHPPRPPAGLRCARSARGDPRDADRRQIPGSLVPGSVRRRRGRRWRPAASSGDPRRDGAARHAMGIEPDPDEQALRKQESSFRPARSGLRALGHAVGTSARPAARSRSPQAPTSPRLNLAPSPTPRQKSLRGYCWAPIAGRCHARRTILRAPGEPAPFRRRAARIRRILRQRRNQPNSTHCDRHPECE